RIWRVRREVPSSSATLRSRVTRPLVGPAVPAATAVSPQAAALLPWSSPSTLARAPQSPTLSSRTSKPSAAPPAPAGKWGDASAGGKGGDGWGGGIYNSNGATLVVTGSTITGNQALSGAGATDGQGVGGGVYLAAGGTATIKDSIITGNHASTSDDDVFGDFE